MKYQSISLVFVLSSSPREFATLTNIFGSVCFLMNKRGLGLTGKLIVIFSLLYGLLLGGMVTVSIFFFVRAKKLDARYRVADVSKSIHLARKWMSDEALEAYITQLLGTRFEAENYDLRLVEIEIQGREGILHEQSRDAITGSLQRFTVPIRNPETETVVDTIRLSYSLANLEKGMWELVWMIIGVGAVAFLIGILLILFFSHRSTAHLRELAAAMQNAGEGMLNSRVEIRSSDEVGLLGEKFNWMMHGLEEGEFVKGIFKRYVTRQVAEKILEEKDLVHLAGDRREVSILFADIRGFTRLSRNMPPEDIISLLNHYFAPIIDVIIKSEGVLDKFIGDGFLAFWNAPLPQQDYALKTCKVALDIKRAVEKLNLERRGKGEIVINMGMGIHTGTAIAGNIGSPQRMEYTIIGESVNFAERLQEAAVKGEILVSERTYQLVGNRLKFLPRKLRIEDYGDKEIGVYELLADMEENI